LPARNSSTDFGLAASTSSMIFSIAPVSVICFRPLGLDDRVASCLSPAHSASKTSLAILLEIVLSAMRRSGRPVAGAEIGAAAISISFLVEPAESSPITQLAHQLGVAAAPAASVGSK
jgi:hypothetical protein